MAIALGGTGCGGDDTSEDGGGCFDYSSFDGTTPAVSLRTDVVPIFQVSCSFGATCHGAMTGSAGFTYLGPTGVAPTDAELAAIIAQNVGVNPTRNAGMPRITANDPARSFLMHKMDNTLTCGDLACAGDNSCGVAMPQGQPTLEQGSRDTVRRWIAQGAQDN
jgi:hypothetical protein